MMPSLPCAYFVVGQPRLALAPRDAFLNAMLRLGHARKLRQWCIRMRVRQVIIVLGLAVLISGADYHQPFRRHLGLPALGVRLDPRRALSFAHSRGRKRRSLTRACS